MDASVDAGMDRRGASRAWVRALAAVKRVDDEPDGTLLGDIARVAAVRPEAPALRGENAALSYGGLVARAWGFAAWARAQGFGPGDVVALLMNNCPDYVAIWLGLSQAGCVVALCNTHLTAEGLAHSVRAAGAVAAIVGPDFAGRVAVERLWVTSAIDVPDAGAGGAAPRGGDTALLIFTSGTTGFPKAARVSHARLRRWSFWFAGLMAAGPADRLYDCLPMYHSTGGVVAVGAMLCAGGAVVVRERFSASRFWDDILAEDCTIFQYIGELCRYLALAPPGPAPAHRLRLACGNGLSRAVWETFQARFAVPRILEFYAATEGNVSLYNVEGRVGALGRVPGFLAHRAPLALIRLDAASGAPLRGADGLCLACGAGEVGEAVGRMGAGAQAFEGYTDAQASAAKILRDVFAPGDRWLRTGDLMRKDGEGFYYFVDRAADGFRWKGENVASAEVEAVLARCPGVRAAVVYGVEIPGAEGQAGMAAITVGAEFSQAEFLAHCAAHLPTYAMPRFLRICARLDLTGTMKFDKRRLRREGFLDTDEPVWRVDVPAGRMSFCDGAMRRALARGEVRVD